MTVDEIYSQMAQTFQTETGLALAGDGDMAVRLYTVAAQIYALYVQADWVARQCFPQTALGDYLDKHAQLRGLERRDAVAAVGVLRFSVPSAPDTDLSIPAGTVCLTAAQAVEAGAAGNAAAGTIRAMAVAPVGVSQVTNPEAFTGGADVEDDEALRARVLETFRRMPNGANAAFYEQEALSFPEVAAASVVPRPRGVGTVDVVIATAAGLPDSELLEAVTDHLEAKREIAVELQVKAPTARQMDVTVQVAARAGADSAAVIQAVKSAIQTWFDGKLLGQSVLRAKLGDIIYEVEGVENYAITAPAAGDHMSHADYLRELLRPLRVYELTGTANGGELDAVGEALDGGGAALDEVQREMLISTAEDWGLEAIESLLVRRPVAPNLNRRRQALAALLRIGGDSFTLEAINDNLKGCGLNAVAVETDTPGVVEVYFPDVPGIPDGFDEMKKILEYILPSHLEIQYKFWYITWALMEERFDTWGDIEAISPTWEELEKMVQEDEAG